MKKRVITRTVLLTAALAGTMASCQKEEFQNEMVLPSHEMSQKNLAHINTTLRYWIDGVEHNQEYASQQEMDEYISYLIGLTREGKTIIIQGSENPSYAPAENDTKTFTTSDEGEIQKWGKEMKGKGYNVKITFDEETGLYTGTATKGGSRSTMAASLLERE